MLSMLRSVPVLPPRAPVAGMVRFSMLLVILAHSVEEHSCCLWGGWCLCPLRVAGPFLFLCADSLAEMWLDILQHLGAQQFVGASSQGARTRNGTLQYASGSACTFSGGTFVLSIALVLPPRAPVAGMIRFCKIILAHFVEEHSCCLCCGQCRCFLPGHP